MLDAYLRWLGLDGFATLRADERALAIVAVTSLCLFAIAVLFAILVVLLRMQHVRAGRRRVELTDRLEATLLDVLGGAVPVEALHALVRPGDDLQLIALLMRFARRVRGEEARLLSRIAGPALPRLARELRRRSPELRALAVEGLAAFGMPAYASSVLAALDDPSPYVAMTAAQALAKRDHAAHVDAVVRRLARFSNWSPSFVSAMVARIGEQAAPAVRRTLADPHEPARVRATAADVLGRLNDPAGADLAAAVLDDTALDPAASSTTFQASALRLIAQAGHLKHRPSVRSLLDAPSAIARAEAVRALSFVGDADDHGALVQALDDDSSWVAYEGAFGLARAGRADLLARAAAGDGPVAVLAQQALADTATA